MKRHRTITDLGAAAPKLLLAFFAAVIVMVGAVAVIGLTDSDWAVAFAVALMLCLLWLVLSEISGELHQGAPPDSAGASRRARRPLSCWRRLAVKRS
jgi:hypothetical protein